MKPHTEYSYVECTISNVASPIEMLKQSALYKSSWIGTQALHPSKEQTLRGASKLNGNVSGWLTKRANERPKQSVVAKRNGNVSG